MAAERRGVAAVRRWQCAARCARASSAAAQGGGEESRHSNLANAPDRVAPRPDGADRGSMGLTWPRTPLPHTRVRHSRRLAGTWARDQPGLPVRAVRNCSASAKFSTRSMAVCYVHWAGIYVRIISMAPLLLPIFECSCSEFTLRTGDDSARKVETVGSASVIAPRRPQALHRRSSTTLNGRCTALSRA